MPAHDDDIGAQLLGCLGDRPGRVGILEDAGYAVAMPDPFPRGRDVAHGQAFGLGAEGRLQAFGARVVEGDADDVQPGVAFRGHLVGDGDGAVAVSGAVGGQQDALEAAEGG